MQTVVSLAGANVIQTDETRQDALLKKIKRREERLNTKGSIVDCLACINLRDINGWVLFKSVVHQLYIFICLLGCSYFNHE